MKRTLFSLLLVVVVCFFSVCAEAVTYKFTPLDYPGAIMTAAFGIDDGNIVGLYITSSFYGGFLYDGTNWTTLNPPDPALRCYPFDISGEKIVGECLDQSSTKDQGFLYNITTREWVLFDYPGTNPANHCTRFNSVDGNKIVGFSYDGYGGEYYGGFIYDQGIPSWTPINYPGAFETFPIGTDGEKIVGTYCILVGTYCERHAFLRYDENGWATLDKPDADFTEPAAIDGKYVVGRFVDATGEHGFLYDGTNWTLLDFPGAQVTNARGISGSKIVGHYTDTNNHGHGFIATPINPTEQIGLILQFFDQSVSNGTLIGDGPGRSGNHRLNALGNMLEAAQRLIEEGSIAEVCQQLLDAYKKTDGNPKPPDFVTGEAASELARMIQDLRASMGCQ
jgi:hypothetical protein